MDITNQNTSNDQNFVNITNLDADAVGYEGDDEMKHVDIPGTSKESLGNNEGVNHNDLIRRSERNRKFPEKF